MNPEHVRHSTGALAPASLAFILKQFFLPAVFLTGIPFPLLLILQYKTGDLLDMAWMIAAWAVLACVYCLPVGVLLFRWNGPLVARAAAAYLISLPLYFLALALIFPAFGFRFHPPSPSAWGIYLCAAPVFFLPLLLLYLLVRGGRAPARPVLLSASVFLAGLAASLVLWASIDKYTWPPRTSSRVAIVNARIVDAADNQIIEGLSVHIENGRIANLAPASAEPFGWPQIDAHGAYLLPGLIDVHAHVQAPMRSVLGGFEVGYLFKSLLGDYAPQRREYLENGVVAIRDAGGPSAHIFSLRSKLERQELLGPHLYAVGRLITSPRGHPVSTIWTPSMTRQGAILASSPASLSAGLEKNFAAGPPDALKIIYGTVGIAKEKISEDLLARAVAWARDRHLTSVVHIGSAEEAIAAVQAGATGIEHFATIETLPDSLLAAIAAHRTFLDPTFGELRSVRALTGSTEDAIERELRLKYGLLRRAYDAGARLTVGTDAPFVPFGQGLQDELGEYEKCGFTPAQILVFATLNNAAYLGKAGELGRIAPSYTADLFLVRENPLAGLRALRKPLWVMLAGQIVVGQT